MKNKPIRHITGAERDYAKANIRRERSYKTICQLIRDVFIEAERSNNSLIKGKTLDIYVYAKRMNNALRNRNGAYDAGWWTSEGKESPQEELVPFTTA
jgi:hypothetical protein